MLRVVFLVASALLATPALAASFGIFQASNTTAGWHVLPNGPSTFLPGMQLIASDNTIITRADQYNCWIGTASTSPITFTPLLTTNSMPSGSVTDADGGPIGAPGCDEAVADPGNTQDIWVQWGGTLYRSLNRGVSFTETGMTYTAALVKAGFGGSKFISYTVAVDPNNPDVVYAATPSAGVQFSNNGTTTATFSGLTSIPPGLPPGGSQATTSTSSSVTVGTGAKTITNLSASLGLSAGTYVLVWETSSPANSMFGTVTSNSGTSLTINSLNAFGSGSSTGWSVGEFGDNSDSGNGGGWNIIVFDKHGGTTTVGGQTRTANIYIAANGIGVYESTDGGQTWAKTSGTNPTNPWSMVVDPNGVLWVASFGQASGAFSYNGSWTQYSVPTGDSVGFSSVAFDPNSCASEGACHVAFAVGGYLLCYTANGASTFNCQTAFTYSSPNAPTWIASWNTNLAFQGLGGIAFDSSSNLWWSDEGMWYVTAYSSGSTTAFTSNTAGIEAFEGDTIISPAAGTIVMGGWDVGQFYNTNVSNFPTTAVGSTPYASAIQKTNSVSQAPGTTTVVAFTQWGKSPFTSLSASSNNNGASGSWTAWASDPTTTACSGGQCFGGCVAASTATNWVVAPSDEASGNVLPFYTTNGGTSWTQITVSGVPGGWPYRHFDTNQICDADKVTSGVFYFYSVPNGVSDHVVKCTSGGASCSAVSSPGLGSIAQFNSELKAVPGQAGYIFLSAGAANPPSDSGGGLWYSSNGGTTVNQVTGFTGVVSFGFGGTFSGHTFASIWVAGYYNNVWGIWRSKDWDSSQTWQQMTDSVYGAYPAGMALPPYMMDGDKTTPQIIYGVTQSGTFWGYFNFLLNRDLDPAANDNSPVGLSKAA